MNGLIQGEQVMDNSIPATKLIKVGDGTKYLADNGVYNSIPEYVIKQFSTQLAHSLTNGQAIEVISTTVPKVGILEVDFIAQFNATVSAVLAVLTSDAVFASITIDIRLNNESQLLQRIQLSRSGTSLNDGDTKVVKAIINATTIDDIVSVFITANESGVTIPVNTNTRLIIKG